ncbi:MAG: endo-1,4-beta-xylanase [Leptolyngbyaceae cyanobacterium MAG.088]|nr:endo-1,4-beta-xylanase [Leptolyngbyaceae cyanobacterium MAG.088]
MMPTRVYEKHNFESSLSGLKISSCGKQIPTSPVPLRSLAQRRGIGIGTAVKMQAFYSDAQYRKVLAHEFNVLTPENALKFGRLSLKRDRYSFKDADALIAFAEKHQMQVHGHTLVWYRNLPEWLTQGRWSRAELIAILQQHIDKVVSRYRGRIAVWDVVNEAIENDGSLRDSIWLRGIGPEYIAMAFRWAHKADPQALLLYNDYRSEEMNRKSEAVYQLVRTLKQQGIPIHAVGWQMHKGIKEPPDFQQIKANMQRLNNLGVEVQITEMDVGIYSGQGTYTEKLAAQADIYRDVMTICLESESCSAFITWGLADHHSWRPAFFGHPDAPLLFDKRYQPKPAYEALIDVLHK